KSFHIHSPFIQRLTAAFPPVKKKIFALNQFRGVEHLNVFVYNVFCMWQPFLFMEAHCRQVPENLNVFFL
ncbi:MAG: hypothetical protein II114_06190, partial [Treponema sp.]|nr:hypothetical protein [Treponema sp.]